MQTHFDIWCNCHSCGPHTLHMECYHNYSVIWHDDLVVIKLTGTVSQVLLINRSLPDDWWYDTQMLQLLGTAGTIRKIWGLSNSIVQYELLQGSWLFNVSHCRAQRQDWVNSEQGETAWPEHENQTETCTSCQSIISVASQCRKYAGSDVRRTVVR